jgi:hypothetical protein
MLKRVSRLASTAALIVSVALLAACTREGEGASEQASAPSLANSGPAKTQPVEAVSADMVSAVSSSKEGGLVDLKFALKQHPGVGQPVDVELALIPASGVQRMHATFVGNDGLELSAGGKTPTYEGPQNGVPVSHTLTIVPSRDGVFYLTATVLVESSDTWIARTFAIPVIAGEGLSAKAEPKVAASPVDATKPVANAPAANSRQAQ